MPGNHDLTLRQLTYKLTMLLALASDQRVQTLHKLDIEWLTGTESAFCFTIPTRLKQTKSGRDTPDIYLPKSDDERICVWHCLWVYLLRTEKICEHTELLLITVDPFSPATPQSISQWLRKTLALAGVDSRIFTAHSTRSAASSKAHKFIPLEKVMEAADWRSSATFVRHYRKPVKNRGEFAQAVWSEAKK